MTEKNLINFHVVDEMVNGFWTKMQMAVTANDISKVAQYTALGERIERLKQDLQSVTQQFEDILTFIEKEAVISYFDIAITDGMLRNRYLSLKPISDSQINKSILPVDGAEILVSFPEPIGTISTSYLKQYNRLKDRGNVSAFYDEHGIMEGSIVRFTQIKHNSEYSVEVIKKF